MIEIGQRSKFIMSYNDAVFYCFCLGVGWRLPTDVEWDDMCITDSVFSWYQDENFANNGDLYHATPVRDTYNDI